MESQSRSTSLLGVNHLSLRLLFFIQPQSSTLISIYHTTSRLSSAFFVLATSLFFLKDFRASNQTFQLYSFSLHKAWSSTSSGVDHLPCFWQSFDTHPYCQIPQHWFAIANTTSRLSSAFLYGHLLFSLNFLAEHGIPLVFIFIPYEANRVQLSSRSASNLSCASFECSSIVPSP